MKKILVILAITLCLTTGCGNDTKVLECIQNDDKTTVTIKNGKIIKIATNEEEEKVTSEEWETLKNFYEFTGKETSEEVANHLKELNESVGYTCTLK